MEVLDYLRFETPTKVNWQLTREAIEVDVTSKHLVNVMLSNSALIEVCMKEARRFVRKYSPGTAYRLCKEHQNQS